MNISETLSILRSTVADRPKEAILIAQKVIQEAKKLQDTSAEAYGLLYLGLSEYLCCMYDQSLVSLTEAQESFQDLRDHRGVMLACNAIGGVHLDRDQYEMALGSFLMLEDIALKHNDLDRLTAAYINLGVLYGKAGFNERSQKYLSKSSAAVSVTKNTQHQGTISLAHAYNHQKQGDFQAAIGYLEDAERWFRIDSRSMLSEVYLKRAENLFELQEFEAALEAAESSHELAMDHDQPITVMRALYLSGKIHTDRNELETAEAQLLEAYRIAEDYSDALMLSNCCKVLTRLYGAAGDFTKALELAQESWRIDAERFEQLHRLSLSNSEILQQLQRAEQERDMLRKRSEKLVSSIKVIHKLEQIIHEIISVVDFDLAIKVFHTQIQQVISFDRFALYLLDQDKLVLRWAYLEQRPITLPDIPVDDETSLAAYCFRSGQMLKAHGGLEDISRIIPKYVPTTIEQGARKILSLPLISRGETIGVCLITVHADRQFSEQSVDIMKTVTDFIAISAANANMQSRLRRSNTELREKQEYLKETLEELQDAHAQIERLATFDALTGLPNRYLFEKRLQEIIHLATRNKTLFGICFIDLDNFKTLNDTYGHHEGDRALSICGRRISEIVRKSDLIARYGGDEFIGVFYDIKEQDDLTLIAQKIIDTLKVPIPIGNSSFSLGASIGISIFPTDDTIAERLIQYADAALYEVKETAKGTYRFHRKTIQLSQN